jgi:hypothetical protein
VSDIADRSRNFASKKHDKKPALLRATFRSKRRPENRNKNMSLLEANLEAGFHPSSCSQFGIANKLALRREVRCRESETTVQLTGGQDCSPLLAQPHGGVFNRSNALTRKSAREISVQIACIRPQRILQTYFEREVCEHGFIEEDFSQHISIISIRRER